MCCSMCCLFKQKTAYEMRISDWSSDVCSSDLCPNQRRNIMSTTEKDGIAGPKQDEDLRRNPGIGQSKGTTAAGEKVEEIEGDNTVEGDIENDPDAAGGVDPNRLGRTNK